MSVSRLTSLVLRNRDRPFPGRHQDGKGPARAGIPGSLGARDCGILSLKKEAGELGGKNRQGAGQRSLLWESTSHGFEPPGPTTAESRAGRSSHQRLKLRVSQL